MSVRAKDAIVDEKLKEAITLKCRLCGRSFSIKPENITEDWQYIYCSEECREMDSQVEEERKSFIEK